MRITTLNVWGYTDWPDREQHITSYLKEVDSDIILLQEDVFLPHVAPISPVRALARALDYPYIHESITRLQSDPQGRPYREGLAILSKYAVRSSESLSLIKDPRDQHQRIVQFADVETPEGVMKLANVHLSITDDYDLATPQLRELIGILRGRDEQRIMTGDFNVHGMHGLSEHRSIWEPEYYLFDEPEYISFPETADRLDYFIVPKSITATNLTVSPDELSDHRAVTIDVDLGK